MTMTMLVLWPSGTGGNLGDGEHTAIAYDNGVKFAESTFTVTTTGEAFLTGAQGPGHRREFSKSRGDCGVGVESEHTAF